MTRRVRPAAPQDAAAVRRLEGLSPASRRLLDHDLAAADRCCLVAEEDGEVVGYAAAIVRLGQAEVTDLVVAADRRRRGIGRALLDELERQAAARGATATTLEVRRGNTAALALYRGSGFVVEGERPRYYPDGEDALLLWRRS